MKCNCSRIDYCKSYQVTSARNILMTWTFNWNFKLMLRESEDFPEYFKRRKKKTRLIAINAGNIFH